MQHFYSIKNSERLGPLLQEIDLLRKNIDEKKPLDLELWSAIQAKLRIEWTYDTNALEGSTLTYGETLFFLNEGLTVEGKPFKDFLDARNHAEAIEYLYDVIKDKRPVSQGLIKEFNRLLLSGITHTAALDEFGQKLKKPATPGQYKRLPNHVLQPDGTIHRYTDPVQVVDEMEYLCNWLETHLEIEHPVVCAAVSHYNMVRIHPFDDGNGRGARLLMNLLLLQKGYPPAIVRVTKRRGYLDTLSQADHGELSPFVQFIGESLLETQKLIWSEIGG
jgi:Fic family protein